MKGKIFNAQEVQSIIAGTKTMFREVIKPRIKVENYKLDDGSGIGMEILLEECPYQVGQKIFCKEAFALRDKDGKYFQFRPFKAYKADAESDFAQWKLAQHMKQEHSRLTLEITDIKVERLKDISEEDCIKEGISERDGAGLSLRTYEIKDCFRTLWNTTHKKPEEKFEANPFVWVVDFKINK